jgi:hypothetical protein
MTEDSKYILEEIFDFAEPKSTETFIWNSGKKTKKMRVLRNKFET